MYSVSIVGAGSIGALKPMKYDNPENRSDILTWAHAVYEHPKTNLSCIIDNTLAKGIDASIKWKCNSAEFVKELDIAGHKSDIIIVATPTETHYSVLGEILELENKPKLVVCEKPFTSSYAQAEDIQSAYLEKGISLAIGYMRRYLPEYQKLAYDIKSGKLGKLQSINIFYNRGLKRECSHALNLLELFGVKTLQDVYFNPNTAISDYSKYDKTLNCYLYFEECPSVNLIALDGRKFSAFEIDIVGTKGRVILAEHGKYRRDYNVIPERTYGDYNMLNSIFQETYTELEKGLLYSLTNFIDHIENETPLLSVPDDALFVHSVIDEILSIL